MTREEIEKRIVMGKTRSIEKHNQIEDRKKLAKTNTEELRKMGFKVRYRLLEDDRRIAVAYKWDFMTNQCQAFFTIRSDKDPFCRADAKKSLVDHIKNRTNQLSFSCNSTHNKTLRRALWKALKKRVETHPYEFPSKLVKKIKFGGYTIA